MNALKIYEKDCGFSDSKNRASVLVGAAEDMRLADGDYMGLVLNNWDTCDGITIKQARAIWKTRQLPRPLFQNCYATRRFRKLCNGEPIWIYRGQIKGFLNFSWTLDFNKAHFFARQYPFSPRCVYLWGGVKPGDTEILMAKVEPSEVLGFFTSRRESEVIIDPGDMSEIQVHPLSDVKHPRMRED